MEEGLSGRQEGGSGGINRRRGGCRGLDKGDIMTKGTEDNTERLVNGQSGDSVHSVRREFGQWYRTEGQLGTYISRGSLE